MKANATVAEWYKQHGKHAVYAKNQHLPIIDGELTVTEHALAIEERERGEVRLKRKPTVRRKSDKPLRRRLPVVA
jgi:hypothetical protein